MGGKKLGYGIIGCGGIASLKHLSVYSKMQDIELVAACDADYDRASSTSREYHIPNVFTDSAEMLAMKDLDVVSICVPNFLHAPIAIAALEAGKHVHLEKPPALTSAEVQAIIDARNKSGKKLMTGLNFLFFPSTAFVKNFIEQGGMGEIYSARCSWMRRRGIPGKGGWFTDKSRSGGGPLIDLGVHLIELLIYFMGGPKAVSVSGSTYCKFANASSKDDNFTYSVKVDPSGAVFDVEDTAFGFIRLDNGATLTTEFAWASNIEEEYNYYQLLGTKAGIEYRNGALKVFSEINGTLVDIAPKTVDIPWGDSEMRHFIDCIQNDTEPAARLEDSMEVMRIIEKLYTSAQNGSEMT